MPPSTPITLTRTNLGERHRELNALVSEAIKLGEPIEDILELPEKSAVDRLFKIKVASNHRHVQYILKNLREDDMLYVSTALKTSRWLLEAPYKELINPVKLETTVYPEMILPAVNKMRHWIHLNLQDEKRCQEFYHYYCDDNRELAMKYLLKCPVDLILKEIPSFFECARNKSSSSPHTYITPHYFKMFCERSPLVGKVVYDMVEQDTSSRLSCIDRQYQYFNALKCILKREPDIYLDIIEKHFNVHRFGNLSSAATRFILTHKKDRFLQKPELYTAMLLDIDELAKCLSSEECEELVIKLVRSKFLLPWYDYKMVEPLINRIDKNEQDEFKKRVFVRKEVGEDVNDWPYPPPRPSIEDDISEYDDSSTDNDYDDESNENVGTCPLGMSSTNNRKMIAHLDNLFKEYSIKSFMESMVQLSQKILAESSPLSRMHMIMVLVSKIDENEKNLEAFLKFLMKHRIEPLPMKAVVMRRIVNHASIWRVSDDVWDTFLKLGEDLYLIGDTKDIKCKEVLHAVVIRSLMKTDKLAPEVTSSYLKNFSSLTEYPLSKAEKSHILNILPKLLLEIINAEPAVNIAVGVMEHLLDTLEVTEGENRYDVVIPTVKKLLEIDEPSVKRISKRLFDSKIGRKDFFTHYSEIIQSDESYLNILRHDIKVISIDKFLKAILIDNINLDRFLRKTNVYFAEDGGLASRLLNAMKKEKPHFNLARPISSLIGANMKTYISKMDVKREVCKDDKDLEKFCAALRANAHLARPGFDIDAIAWHQAGVKLVANKLLICREADIDKYIEKALLWKRSIRLAIVLARRVGRSAEVLQTAATVRPTIVIKVALDYFKCGQSGPRIWKTIKPLIIQLDSGNNNFRLMQKLEQLNDIPESIKPEYIQIMYSLFLERKPEDENFKFDYLLQIYKLLPQMEPQFINNLLLKFLESEFNTKSNLQTPVLNKGKLSNNTVMQLKILAKYLLICKNENEQNERFTCLGDLFFDKLDKYKQKKTADETYHNYLKTFLCGLKSNTAFFSNEYVSCLQVMQKVLKRMHSQLPTEEYFILYVEVHLSMLYYLAVKEAIKKIPKLFVGEVKDQKKNKEGLMLIARIFGKYIAFEAKQLTSSYFMSVVEVYAKGLKDYFLRFKEPRYELSLPLVKGIIEGSEGFEGKLAIDLFNEYHKSGEEWDEVRNLMIQKFDKNVLFLMYDSE